MEGWHSPRAARDWGGEGCGLQIVRSWRERGAASGTGSLFFRAKPVQDGLQQRRRISEVVFGSLSMAVLRSLSPRVAASPSTPCMPVTRSRGRLGPIGFHAGRHGGAGLNIAGSHGGHRLGRRCSNYERIGRSGRPRRHGRGCLRAHGVRTHFSWTSEVRIPEDLRSDSPGSAREGNIQAGDSQQRRAIPDYQGPQDSELRICWTIGTMMRVRPVPQRCRRSNRRFVAPFSRFSYGLE